MSKISLGQLDLVALQQYFEIVAGFRKKDDKAIDVQYVGEYEHPTVDDTDNPVETEKTRVMAHQIAMAVDKVYRDENDVITIPERNTVQNALMLDGVPAAAFLKTEDSEEILTDVNQATHFISDDIRNLKDELYQLKNQLIKTGAIKDSAVYNGFIDSFIESNPKHEHKIYARLTASTDGVNNIINVDSSANFTAGELIVLDDGKEGYGIYKIAEIADGNTLTLDREFMDITGHTVPVIADFSKACIKKSLGVGQNGKFVFGCDPLEGFVITDTNKYIVKDGVDRVKVFELDHMGHGFGTEIKIPSSLKNNIISGVKVSLAVKGDPGAIMGMFYKIDPSTNLPDTKNPIGKTSTITPMMASGWFNDFDMQLINEMEVQPGEKYIFVLVTISGGDEDNKWYIGGFNDDECLEDVHNDCYILSNDLLYVSLEDKDMFLILSTKTKTESKFRKLNYGLYTCEFDVYQSLANRVRIELCVNQEGLFKVKDDNIVSLAKARTNAIDLETRNPKVETVVREPIFNVGDAFVIGTQIGEVAYVGNNNSSLVPYNDMYVQSNADVYRVGYEIQIIASNKILAQNVGGAVAAYEDATIYDNSNKEYVKFAGVVPGRDIIRPDKSSDRLLFECDFVDKLNADERKLKSFNHIEVQVRWFSNVSNATIQTNEELEGAIFDIAVSVDQAYTRSENEVE